MWLIELMVAIEILCVGLLGMAGLSLTVNSQFGTAGRQADAALLLQSRNDSLSTVSRAPGGRQRAPCRGRR